MNGSKNAAKAVAIFGGVFQRDEVSIKLIEALVTLHNKLFDHVVKIVHSITPLVSVSSRSSGNSMPTGQSA